MGSGAAGCFLLRMVPGDAVSPDWRDADGYAPLREAERAIFAWEWLRRDETYREAARAAQVRKRSQGMGVLLEDPKAAAWHLHTFEDPDRSALTARPVWRANNYPRVLRAEAVPDDRQGDFLLARFGSRATLIRGAAGEHLLLSNGLRALRIDLVAGSLATRPVRLHYRLSGLAGVAPSLMVLHQLISLWRTGRFSRTLHPPATRAERMVLMLRVHDALQQNATQREIAGVLLSGEADEPQWRIRAPTVRLRVQRLVRAARAFRGTGFAVLLAGART